MLEEKNIFVGGVEYTADRKTLIHFPEDLELQDYTVPEGTEGIGITAFFNCQQLHSVILPQSLQEIDSNAFQQCCNLQTLTIPANVKTIAPNAFLDCPAKLVSESPDFTVDRFGALIWKNKTLLCIPTELEYYEVPENVIFIGSDVCMFGKLRKIVLHDNVLSIGDNAFIGCENLQFVDLPETLLEVGSNAFYMTACEEEMQKKYPSLFNSNPVKEYIAQSIRKVRENGGSFKKVNADTAENADWLRQHRKNEKEENQMNKNHCADCGDESADIKFKDRFYCKCCANFLMAKLKLQYYAGMKKLGWEIQDLWDQLRDPTDLWTGDAESFLEADEIRSYQHEDMALYYRSPDAQTMLRAFVREKLDGDIRNFKEFDFETLKYDELFGCINPQKFDCDNTYIIRAVYVLLWSKVFPDMTDWREIGTGKCYRGDTIHTFHTIFGRPNPEKPGHFYGIDQFSPDNALYDRIRSFHKKICTLGNFVVLPNFTVKSGKSFATLNTYRGTNHWRDYFDQFLLALEPCLVNGCNADETLYKLVHERNGYAFENYKNQEGFTRMIKALLLDDYLDTDGHAKNLFADASGKVRFHWEKPQPPRELYLQGVTNYLDHAEKIISDRADRMIKMLKEFC